MALLIVLLASWVFFGILGAAGVDAFASWTDSLRGALAAMFCLTAGAHFAPRLRADLIRMVPPRLSRPDRLVTLTGVLEFAGAVGLLIPGLARWAALGLATMLVAMFPANIHAARTRVTLAGKPAMPLIWRLPLQILWLGMLLAVAWKAG